MSDHRPRAGGGGREADDRVTNAALAAVEGRGTLGDDALASVDEELVDEFERAAGLVFRAMHGTVPRVPPPADLRERLEAASLRHLERRTRKPISDGASDSHSNGSTTAAFGRSDAARQGSARGRRSPRLLAWSGWAVAAGALAFGLTRDVGPTATSPSPAPVTVDDQLAALLEDADTSVSPWAVGDVTGDVVWNDERNQGFMRLSGLPVNDPATSQYQLWIFRGDDPASEDHPVDGGVFDIRTSKGTVTVPIDAKLQVGGAGFFAVTVERPGGVVVSDREQIVAAAPRA